MSQYNVGYGHSLPPLSLEGGHSFRPSFDNERHDEQGSLSGSEDGNYALYPDVLKAEAETEEDTNAALTSQTLNADGTPKRPMNAFMIFARRRRPQVSSENQSMRTGEISKILSKEWNTMPGHEKQFYLDQAKHLKETFNTRYPDYVYRRRPNNSRKRRRTDGHIRSVDNPHPMDHADDYVGDLGEPSPTEGEESSHGEPPSLSSFSRPSHDVSQSFGEKYGSSRSRSSGHPYSPSDSFRSNGAHEHRLPYVSPQNSERLSSSLGSTASLSSPRLTQPTQPTLQYPYGAPGQGQSPLYHTEHPEPRETWTPRVERGPSSWLGGNRERSLTSIGGQKPHSYSASAGPGSWPPSASSSMSASSSSTPQTTHYAFPTLTSPFYPNQPQPTFQQASATSTSHSSSSTHYDTTHIPPASMSRDFDNRGYGPSPSVSPAAAYPSGQSRDSLPYPQRSGSRGLPSVHAMSGYVPTPPSSSGSGPANPGSQGYWTR